MPSIIKSDLTDHYCTIFNISTLEKTKNSTVSQIQTHKLNLEKLNIFLNNENWEGVLSTDDSLESTKKFYETITNHIKASQEVISITRKKKKLKPWITYGLIKSIETRDKLKKKLSRDKENQQLRERYKQYRNSLTELIKAVKTDYYKQKILDAGNSTGKIWKTINEITNNNPKSVDLSNIAISYNDEIYLDETKKCNALNDYYITMAEKLSPTNKNKSATLNKNVSNSLFLAPVVESEIKSFITSLKNNSSPGPDNVSALALKQNSSSLLKPLAHIINCIFRTGAVPPEFKDSVVTPIYKSDDKTLPQNYRPISVINHIAKIFEKALKSRLVDFLNKNSILSSNQYGFREGLCTGDAIYSLLNEVYNSINNKNKTLAIFIDLCKAFDMVNHTILINKLEKLGMRGVVLELFKNYLFNRTQRVKINSHVSGSMLVKRGVPQGTVLGPILFLIYINDMNDVLQSGKLVSYADDTVLLFSGKTWAEVRTTASNELSIINKWTRDNNLLLNLRKTKYIKFSLTDIPQDGTGIIIHECNNKPICNCLNITETNTIKYLGIEVDSNLRWDIHADSLSKQLSFLIYKFYLLRSILDKNLIIMLYKSLVESRLRYCNVVWGGLCNEHLIKVENVQKRIIKTIFKLNRMYPSSLLFSENGLLTVRGLYILDAVSFVHSSSHFSQIGHTKNTRSNVKKNLQVQKCNFTAVQKFISFNGPRLYNQIPAEIKNIVNIYRFKKATKQYILRNYQTLESHLHIIA